MNRETMRLFALLIQPNRRTQALDAWYAAGVAGLKQLAIMLYLRPLDGNPAAPFVEYSLGNVSYLQLGAAIAALASRFEDNAEPIAGAQISEALIDAVS